MWCDSDLFCVISPEPPPSGWEQQPLTQWAHNEAKTRNKTEDTMRKGMEKYARKWILYSRSILFEVILAFGKTFKSPNLEWSLVSCWPVDVRLSVDPPTPSLELPDLLDLMDLRLPDLEPPKGKPHFFRTPRGLERGVLGEPPLGSPPTIPPPSIISMLFLAYKRATGVNNN